jgi:alkylation response protein AidB-like acyl-CoA dehydrogenase
VTTFDLSEVHDQLRAVARDLLGKPGASKGRDSGGDGLGAGRRPVDGSVPPTIDWQVLADAGWLGLEVPETLDGAGATFAEIAIVLEEMGRAATTSPYLGTAVLGVGTLNLLEPNPARDGLLRLVASGDRVLAVALATGKDDDPPFRLERSAGGLRLHGSAAFVPDAPDASRLLLLARHPSGETVIAVVHALDETPENLVVTAQPLLDATRRVGVVSADGVEVNEMGVWKFAGDPQASIRRLHDRGAVALTCDSLGLSQAMLDATVGYAKVRHQFGRPIGSFQAIKHACADMLVQVSVSKELVAAAVRSLTSDEPGASVAASMAKSHVCSAAVDVVGKALQLHGGIGYTWESGIHAHLKRAALNRSLFGSPMAHRKRLAARFTVAAGPPGGAHTIGGVLRSADRPTVEDLTFWDEWERTRATS